MLVVRRDRWHQAGEVSRDRSPHRCLRDAGIRNDLIDGFDGGGFNFYEGEAGRARGRF